MKNFIKVHSEKKKKQKEENNKNEEKYEKSFLRAIAKLRGESDADIQGIF